MKGRTVKLREAHKAGDTASTSFCSVIWNSDATHLVTASSSDPSILIHDYAFLSSQQKQQSSSRNQNPKALQVHRNGVTSLAISPDSLCLASGSVDHSVKIHKFPGIESIWLYFFNLFLSWWTQGKEIPSLLFVVVICPFFMANCSTKYEFMNAKISKTHQLHLR